MLIKTECNGLQISYTHIFFFPPTIEYNEFDGISMSKRGWDMGNDSKWN